MIHQGKPSILFFFQAFVNCGINWFLFSSQRHWQTFQWRKAGDLAQSGPVAVGAYLGPGLGAGSAKLEAKWSGQWPSGPPPHQPLGAWKALPIFLAALQPSGRRGLAAPSEGPSPCPPGLETSLASSPHWELSQPSCFPQPLPDHPPLPSQFLTRQAPCSQTVLLQNSVSSWWGARTCFFLPSPWGLTFLWPAPVSPTPSFVILIADSLCL